MTVLIADDHPFTLAGTKAFVEALGHQVVKTCSNGLVAYNLIQIHQPKIAILDISMPGLDGIEVLEKMQQQQMATKVILLTMHRELSVFKKANQYQLYGYLLKEQAETELEKCLESVEKGEKYVSELLLNELLMGHEINNTATDLDKLTFVEKKVLELVVQQKTSKQIGELLFISEKTVEGHRTSIIKKLDLPKGKNTLLRWAMKEF